ncbi:MAG: hypothetical protein H0W44_09635 [Gammaproteobacteria bacterium]|nr:hypothetical protein [Gammaproteobacteria bacterium]
MRGLLLSGLILGLLVGCTNKDIYSSSEGARQQECQDVLTSPERELCLDAANKSYEQYKREQDEVRR